MKAYFTRHAQVFMRTLGDFARSPTPTVMTVMLIGLTLALPTGLYVGLLNLQRLSQGWRPHGSLSVYLKKGGADREAVATIRRVPGVATVRYVSPTRGLREFKTASGLRGMGLFGRHNPLPGVVIVAPARPGPHSVALLATRLRGLPDVTHVQSNLVWVERLDAALAVGRRLVTLLAATLGLALVLILANTTRATVASRGTEISVIRLVGGTNAFIRRPFLYIGALTGGLGALCALLVLEVGLIALAGPVAALNRAYGAHYRLAGLSLRQALALLVLGASLGWLGARIAVARALRQGEI